MTVLILILSFLNPHAEAMSKKLGASMGYACLDLNGIPVQAGSDDATNCCDSNGNFTGTSAACKNGPNSIGGGASFDFATNINLAKSTLDVANSLNGVVTASATPPSTQQASTSADTSGGFTGSTGGATGTADPGAAAGGASAGGAAGPGSGSGGAGSNLGSSGALADTGTKVASVDGGPAGPDSGGAYSKGGDGPPAAGGNLLGGLFGSGGGKNGVDGSDKELKFGDDNGDLNAKNGADPNSITGSPNDALDYLSRIDRTANIFKVVSKRYTSENQRKHIGN